MKTAIFLLASAIFLVGARLDHQPRKDQVAVQFFGGGLEDPILVVDRQRAGPADVFATFGEQEAEPAELQDRPCFGIAIFTVSTWNRIRSEVRSAELIEPQMADRRHWHFPEHQGRRAITFTEGSEVIKVLYRGRPAPADTRDMAHLLDSLRTFPTEVSHLAAEKCDAPIPEES